ncbi:MAG: hypothetical protein HRT87_12360 [Legionellales bacterium]|nr:hypothetical protein [Legionellales bacterium]
MIESIILMFALFFSIVLLRNEISRNVARVNGDNLDLLVVALVAILWGAFYYFSINNN